MSELDTKAIRGFANGMAGTDYGATLHKLCDEVDRLRADLAVKFTPEEIAREIERLHKFDNWKARAEAAEAGMKERHESAERWKAQCVLAEKERDDYKRILEGNSKRLAEANKERDEALARVKELEADLEGQPHSECIERGRSLKARIKDLESGIVVALQQEQQAALKLAASEAACAAMRDKANGLVRQIEINDFVDSHGHHAKMLQALHLLKLALASDAGKKVLAVVEAAREVGRDATWMAVDKLRAELKALDGV